MNDHHIRTLLYWVIFTLLFIGIIAYEWLPASYRGSWIFILSLVIAGAFFRFGVALIVGFITFFITALYFLFDLNNFAHIERQLLVLFAIPFAPLFLSAIRYNLISKHEVEQASATYDFKRSNDILPISAWENMHVELIKMFPFVALDHYELIRIKVVNRKLIEDMLGAAVWKNTQNKILEVLQQKTDGVIYHFSDDHLSEITSVIFRTHPDAKNLPKFAHQLEQIESLKIEIEYILRDIPHSEQELIDVNIP